MFGRKVTCAKRRCAYNQYAVCKCNVLHINQNGECDMYKNELEGVSRSTVQTELIGLNHNPY